MVKGYEYDKGRYVVIEQTDQDNIQLQTTRTIEIVQFAAADELDSIYCNAPYPRPPRCRPPNSAIVTKRPCWE